MSFFKRIKSLFRFKPKKPKALRKKFILDESKFEEFDATLRPHQRKSVEVLNNNIKGQIIIPTGTGKTYIQKHIIVKDMIDKTKVNNIGVYVIAAHRLTLCTQLFTEIISLIIECGIESDMLYVGSEKYDFSKLKDKYKHTGFIIAGINNKRTTSSKEIKKFVDDSIKNSHHVIIVSTYHSFNRLNKLNNIDICTFDEAHTTISKEFTNNINEVKEIIKKQYFFTATKKTIDEKGGQADVEFYGEVLYKMSPKKAIDEGEIVRPFIHTIFIDGEIKGDKLGINMEVKTITESFIEHKNKIKKDSYEPNKIGGKLLVTVNGLEELRSICNDKLFQKWCKKNEIKIFTFSSVDGYFINFKSKRRQESMGLMNSLNDSDDAILFHYDILTEGIDLPSLTGVLLLRDLSLTKLIQNIGRVVRLFKEDRMKIYSGIISSTDYRQMIKPYGLVILPLYPNIDYNNIEKAIKNLRNKYEIPIENIGRKDIAIANTEEFVPVVTDFSEQKNGKDYFLEHIFEDILMEELNQEIDNIDNYEDRIIHIDNMVKKGMKNYEIN